MLVTVCAVFSAERHPALATHSQCCILSFMQRHSEVRCIVKDFVAIMSAPMWIEGLC